MLAADLHANIYLKITTSYSTDYSLIGLQKYRIYTCSYLTSIIPTFHTCFMKLLKISPLAVLQTTVLAHIYTLLHFFLSLT
jgi:hypothetical protein